MQSDTTAGLSSRYAPAPVLTEIACFGDGSVMVLVNDGPGGGGECNSAAARLPTAMLSSGVHALAFADLNRK